ncbi:MAG: DUF362 domain-containing protein [Deltaproteobacteria bacterium]|nr:DUF362 domain-containing protein [Deltaproteobacteria bacterium]
MSRQPAHSPAAVYSANLRADRQCRTDGAKRSLLDKLDELLLRAGVEGRYKKGQIIAIKLHFGERGNTSYIRPVFVRKAVERVKKTGARVFLADTNTLYVGGRTNSADHLETAIANGFAYAAVGAPLIIADGLRGESSSRVRVGGRHFEEVKIAGEIASADGILFLTHFKCHELTGFGGALKNMGMGCASREGKLEQHSRCAPVVEPAGCTACGECVASCPASAIELGAAAMIREDLCTGCAYCIAVCPEGAIEVQWDETVERVQEKMVEYSRGVMDGKEGKCLFINFLTQISPTCDCYGHTDAPIVPDVGILSSIDPVAIDQASADLVNGQRGFEEGTALKSGFEPGGDKFRGVHPQIDWTVQLRYAETIGLGTRRYRIEEV